MKYRLVTNGFVYQVQCKNKFDLLWIGIGGYFNNEKEAKLILDALIEKKRRISPPWWVIK